MMHTQRAECYKCNSFVYEWWWILQVGQKKEVIIIIN